MALSHNILHFDAILGANDLVFDDSFHLNELVDDDAERKITQEAASRYQRVESVMVLSPRNRSGRLSAQELNFRIQELVNPMTDGKLSLPYSGRNRLRDGDRVMVTQNDRHMDVSNGDVGTLHLSKFRPPERLYWRGTEVKWLVSARIEMEDGRCPEWILHEEERLPNVDMAYALTVHKSQGSEYDTVLFAFSNSMGMLRYRNIVYTAISRARERVIIYGSEQALDIALRKGPPPRNCTLIDKYEAECRKLQKEKPALQPAS